MGLILLAYIAFISLGLPDGLLGVAWPSIRATFGRPIDSLGIMLFASTAGYLTSSFSSGRLIRWLGVGRILSLSCAATGLGLIGYALAPAWGVMVGLAVVAGLGAGAIDAGLNTYVASHFGEGLMQWLHASYGIGVMLGPIIMTLGIKYTHTWRTGYALVGALQLVLAASFALTLRMWEDGHTQSQPGEPRRLTEYSTSTAETLRQPAVWLSMLLFFLYTGLEFTLGLWTYSLLTESRGVSPETAGFWAGSYYAMFTIGRIVAGLWANRVGVHALVWGSLLGALTGSLLHLVEPRARRQPGRCGHRGLRHRAHLPRPRLRHQRTRGRSVRREHDRHSDRRSRPRRRAHSRIRRRPRPPRLARGHPRLPGDFARAGVVVVRAVGALGVAERGRLMESCVDPEKARRIREAGCFLFDMDGTIFLGDRLLPGAREIVHFLRARGTPFYFLTNNSSRASADYAAKLTRLGLPVDPGAIFTSGEATALYLQGTPAQRLFVVGTPSLEAEMEAHGFTLDSHAPDAAVLGFDTGLTYAKLWRLCDLVRAGLPYYATHPDFNCPTETGYMPDIGAMIAFVKASTGRDPDQVIGKPNPPIVQAVSKKTGVPPERLVMVGDRLYTDIALGRAGIATVLVLTGETKAADVPGSPHQPDIILNNVGELLELLLER